MIRRKKLSYLLAVIIVLSSFFLYAPTKALAAVPVQNRIGGEDRYETAVKISASGWKQGAEKVVLATGEDFPDALCAAPLAKRNNAPILLTGNGKLDSRVSDELKRLGVKEVFIIGGPGVISQEVEEEINSLDIKCTRIFGNDRYETSAEIAKILGTSSEIVIATGENFPDALSIAPAAAQKGIPIVLSNSERLPEKVIEYLSGRSITKTYIIGGSGVISSHVYDQLSPYGPERISGADRYETNVEVLNKFIKDFNFKETYIATGTDFPDALAGSAIAPVTSSPIVLVDKTPGAVTLDLVHSKLDLISTITVLGGEGVVSKSTFTKLIYGNSTKTDYYTLLKENRYEYGAAITVKNDGSTSVTSITLEIDLGQLNASPYQREESIEVSGEGTKIVTDASGHKKAIITFDSLQSGQSVEYKVTRRFKNSGIKYNVDIAGTSGDYGDFGEYKKYTSPEDKIESDNAEIKDKSAEITKDEKNPYNKAKKIFEFVNTSLDYDFSEANKGALNALRTGKGVCEDFADLFVAMSRSVGVPARIVTGYWIESVSLNNPEDASLYGHAWAEFYLPEFGWIVVEPTVIKTNFDKRVPAYEYFGNLNDPGHFIRGYQNQSSYTLKYYTEGDNDPDVKVTSKEYIKKLQ